MDRIGFLPAVLALVAVAMLPAACARSPAPQPVGKAPSVALMTLAELQRRTVAYAGSIKSMNDVNPAAFSTAIGVHLEPAEPGVEGLTSGELPLAAGYQFFASYVPHGVENELPIHKVAFLPASGVSLTEDPKAECVWDAATAGRELEAIGFHRGAERPFQRGRLQRYWRDLAEENRVFDASLMTYTTSSDAGEKTCVYAVRYSGGQK